jgi:hypothetical protein
MQTFTEEQIEAQVKADYEAVAGKVILLTEVECYDENNDSVTVECDPPVVARVIPYAGGANDECVVRWMDDEACDPVYEIAILEHHPAFDEARARPSWIYGTSRCTTGEVGMSPYVIADEVLQERFRGAEEVVYDYRSGQPARVTSPTMR